jgi:hypothetical protein
MLINVFPSVPLRVRLVSLHAAYQLTDPVGRTNSAISSGLDRAGGFVKSLLRIANPKQERCHFIPWNNVVGERFD